VFVTLQMIELTFNIWNSYLMHEEIFFMWHFGMQNLSQIPRFHYLKKSHVSAVSLLPLDNEFYARSKVLSHVRD
jgi:hypothetical protein